MLKSMSQQVGDHTRGITEKVQATFTSAMLAASKETHRYRRTVEDVHLLLKVDFQVAARCQDLQKNLKTFLTDQERFAPQWIVYFDTSDWTIHERDPQTVVSIKTLMQHLQKIQEQFERIEAQAFAPSRSDVMVMGEFLTEVTLLTHTLARGAESLNRESPHLAQAFYGLMQPLLQMGYQCIGVVQSHQGYFDPTAIRAHVDQFQQHVVTKAPGLPQLSAFLYHLPRYFDQIQQSFNPSAAVMVVDEQVISKQADELTNYLQDYLSQSGLTAFRAGFGGLGLLCHYVVDLEQSGRPLTDEGYQKLLKLTEQIQTQWLPQILIELETLEENLALKPNLLVGPMLEQLHHFDIRLKPVFAAATRALTIQEKSSKQFNRLVWLQNLLFGPSQRLPLPQPQKMTLLYEKMSTPSWMATVLEQRMQRLAQAAVEAEDKTVLNAAKAFLALTDLLGQGVRVSSEQANELRRLYRLIQPYYVLLYPEWDIQFVEHFSQWVEWPAEKHREIGQHVIDLIKHSRYQAAFKVSCIKSERAFGAPLDETAAFYYAKQHYQIEQNKQRIEAQKLPLLAKGRAFEYQSLMGQIQSLKLSKSLQTWMEKQLTPWLKNYLEPEFFSQLIFDKNKIPTECMAPTVLSHDKAAPVRTLQRFIYLLLTLQKNLAALEALPPSLLSIDPLDQLNLLWQQHAVLSKEWPVLTEQIEYLQYYLVEMQCYPAGKALLASFKNCFQKIKAQALFFSTATERAPVAEEQPTSMLILWQQQQALRQAALAGTYQPPAQMVPERLSPKETLLQELKTWMTAKYVVHGAPWVTQIEEMMTDALSIGFNPVSLSAWLKKLDAFLKQLHEAGQDGQDQSWIIFNQLQTSVVAEILVMADDAEFELGLLPGVIAKPLEKRLQSWMTQVLMASPSLAQEAIQLWSYDTSVAAVRLQHQEQRMRLMRQGHQQQQQTHTRNIEQAYQLLQQNSLSQADFLQAYEWLQPILNQLHPRYSKIYFLRNSLVTSQDFVEEQAKMLALKPAVFNWLEQQKIHDVAAQKRAKKHWRKKHIKFVNHAQQQHQAFKEYQHQCFDDIVHDIEPPWIAKRAADKLALFLPTITYWNQQLLIQFQLETMPQAPFVKKPMKEQLVALYQQYEDLITAYTHLDHIKRHIQKYPSTDPALDQSKMDLLEAMQRNLLQTETTPQQRMQRLVMVGLADETQHVLKKQADHPLLALLYCLLRFLFKWQSQQEKLDIALSNQLILFHRKVEEDISPLHWDGIPPPKPS